MPTVVSLLCMALASFNRLSLNFFLHREPLLFCINGLQMVDTGQRFNFPDQLFVVVINVTKYTG